MAIAVISADMLVPFFRTGRYATSSTATPTSAQITIAASTPTHAGRPIWCSRMGMVKYRV